MRILYYGFWFMGLRFLNFGVWILDFCKCELMSLQVNSEIKMLGPCHCYLTVQLQTLLVRDSFILMSLFNLRLLYQLFHCFSLRLFHSQLTVQLDTLSFLFHCLAGNSSVFISLFGLRPLHSYLTFQFQTRSFVVHCLVS